MNLDSFIISILHATIKKHNSPPSTSIPTQLYITVEEENDTNHETQMPHKKGKKHNLFLHVGTFKIGAFLSRTIFRTSFLVSKISILGFWKLILPFLFKILDILS
jgi:hypothetical protein